MKSMASINDGTGAIVPYLVDLAVRRVRVACNEAHLVLVGSNVDGPPLRAQTWPGAWIVTGQRPHPDIVVSRGDIVTIEFRKQGDGDAGDQEQRNPVPGANPVTITRLLKSDLRERG